MMFADKITVVTGAGGGIGRAIARRFAGEGAILVLADANAKSVAETAAMLPAGTTYTIVEGNLCDKAFCQSLIDQAVERYGRIDILINNAGIITRGTILETTDEDWALTLDVNLSAVFYTCRSAIRHMTAQQSGAIVNVASTWGIYAGPGHPAYIMSKAAVASLTKCLARDHARDGIRVNAVCPNEVNTPMLRTGFAKRGFDPDKAVEQLNETVPLGRIAEPEDIADCIAFLASDQARYVAGATLEVSGAKAVY
ncbi:SDR family NAD(P)-dependent oxidoreductase [Lichenifustis flavocetrariae]|uniref:SDR family oxidoreductase n=1 Tax=Lichenifustis flavocetrariae TaxID=2949735 RepID=A0AA41ZB66_9HYPH|nr:SDR family oxidoreductase [Lichenifustis flavocetrariae]MCW6512672.1 SDR family oxidoreductase [Lichenifustis flavocetrariae]